MTDLLTWGENYLQSLFKVAPENLVARKTTISLHERARVWKHANSWEFFEQFVNCSTNLPQRKAVDTFFLLCVSDKKAL